MSPWIISAKPPPRRMKSVKATQDILELLDQIHASNVRANVSVKLSQIGLALDEGLCEKNLEQILTRARQYQNFVRIDMEDTPYTDKTIGMYERMRQKGFENTGLVVQSYLYRTEKDTQCAGRRGDALPAGQRRL